MKKTMFLILFLWKIRLSLIKKTAEEMKKRAIENGLLKEAQRNAENIIESILFASVENIENYEIKFATK